MKVTRRQIIQALRTEPLRTGSWVTKYLVDKKTGKCPVCAVGAALRVAGVSDDNLSLKASQLTFADTNGRIFSKSHRKYRVAAILKEGHYFNALSVMFESIDGPTRRITKRQRETLVRFVKAHFPKELDIGAV